MLPRGTRRGVSPRFRRREGPVFRLSQGKRGQLRKEDGKTRQLQGILCRARPPQHPQHRIQRDADDLRDEHRLSRVRGGAGADSDGEVPRPARRHGGRHFGRRVFRHLAASALRHRKRKSKIIPYGSEQKRSLPGFFVKPGRKE